MPSQEAFEALQHHLEKISKRLEKEMERSKRLELDAESLRLQLQTVLDELDFKNGQVEQIKLEASRKWRVEERDDWKALVDSVQRDREELREVNEKLKELIAMQAQKLEELMNRGTCRDLGDGPSHDSEALQSSQEPMSPLTFKNELIETRARLEKERLFLAQERQESSRLLRELTARRERERRSQTSVVISILPTAALRSVSRLFRRSPLIPESIPLRV